MVDARFCVSLPVYARGLEVPIGDDPLQRVSVARQGEDPLVFCALERVKPVKDVGRLSQRQAEVSPVEGNVSEADHRVARKLLSRQPCRVRLKPRQGHARLDAALHLQQSELHVDGRRQLRLCDLELFELHDLARLGAWGAGRPVRHALDCTVSRGRLREEGSAAADTIGSLSAHAYPCIAFPHSPFAFGPDDWVGSEAICKDRRPSRCPGCASFGCRAARMEGHAGAAEVPRGGRGYATGALPSGGWRIYARSRLFRGPARERRTRAAG